MLRRHPRLQRRHDASASATRPWAASQRGLSGTPRRMNHTATALSEPISTTQRQPEKPYGSSGTSM